MKSIRMIFICLSLLASQIALGENYSLSFDGEDDYVNVGRPLSLDAGDSGSLSVWFKTSSTGNRGVLLTNDTQPTNPDFELSIEPDGTVWLGGYYVGQSSIVQTTESYDDSEWHHAVAIKMGYDGCIQLYVDNEFIGEDSSSPSDDFDHDDDYFIGAGRTDGTWAFSGLIDETQFYNSVLTATEVSELYYQNSVVSSDPVGYWDFNEGSGDTAHDSSLNGNHGTIYGATWSTDVPNFIIPPLDVTATPSLIDIVITWTESTNPELFTYRLFRGTEPEPTDQLALIEPGESSFTDFFVQPNTTYYYRMTCVLNDWSESRYSNEASAQLLPQMEVSPTSVDMVATFAEPNPHDSLHITNWGNGYLDFMIDGSDTLGQNTCLDFDGVDDFVNCGSDPVFELTDFTILLFFRATDADNWGDLVAKSTDAIPNEVGYRLEIFEQQVYFVWSRMGYPQEGDGSAITNVFDLDVWNYLAAAKENDVIRIYLNGVLQDETTGITLDNLTQNPLLFGATHYGYYYNGCLDDVSIWNYPLVQDEIDIYADQPPNGLEEGLIGFWRFNEGYGGVAHDATPYCNHGTLTNMDIENCWNQSEVPAELSFLSFHPFAGVIPGAGGTSQVVCVIANAIYLDDGLYLTSADITHNDPAQPIPFIIPVNLLVDKTAPGQVSNLTFFPEMSQIDLSWNPSPEEDVVEYRICRDLSLQDTTLIATVSAPDTFYIDNDIPDDDEVYHYRVSAVDAVGNEGLMSEAITTWLDIPGPITDLTIHPEGMDIHLNWSPVDTTVYGHPIQNLTGYLVYFNEYAYEDTLFSFLAFTEDTFYVHEYAGQFADALFYCVTAYAGPLGLLEQIVAENPDLKMGELNELLWHSGVVGRGTRVVGIQK